MKLSNNQIESVRNNVTYINDIVYKVSHNTLLTADKALKHIKKNKKIYKKIVYLFALSLGPYAVDYLVDVIPYIINQLALAYNSYDINDFIFMISSVLSKIGFIVLNVLLVKDIAKETYRNLLNKFNII